MPEISGGFELRDPLFLLPGLLAPLLFLLAARSVGAVRYSSVAPLGAAPRSWRVRLAHLPALLLAACVLVLAVALAGPRTGDATSVVEREGIAIAMVVDRSSSMQARDCVRGDASVSRLDAVKRVFDDFVSRPGRSGDLIGLVAFARYADGVCPLTTDRGNLLAILDQVETATQRSEDGTAIGDGLALAVERLRGQQALSKVAILLSDGVDNAGVIAPRQAAEVAATHGGRVYTIGAGRTGYAPFPVQTRGGRTVLQRAYVEMDERTLQRIAASSGGRYFEAGDAEALAEVIDEIDRLERSEITEVRYLEYRHHHVVLVASALGLLGVSVLLSASWLRRLP